MNTPAKSPEPSTVHTSIRRIAVIGTGTVGASWVALFLAHGLDVIAHDPRPDAKAQLTNSLESTMPYLRQATDKTGGQLTFVSELQDAVASVDFIQENAPESYDLKEKLLQEIDEAAPTRAIIASSTSSLLRSRMVKSCSHPSRIIVAHPFNPPHIVPLVEILGEDETVVSRAENFYETIGKTPVRLHHEAVGHIANRLTAALMREALYIVEQGLADVEAVDRAVRAGPGLRWATMGPFLTYHLGGGENGIRHYLEHLGPSQVERWKDLGTPTLNETLIERITTGVETAYGLQSFSELSEERDKKLTDILNALDGQPRN